MSGERSKPTYAVDSNILVWAVKEKGPAEQIRRAKLLFREFNEKKANIIVPAIVLAEYLTDIDPNDHDRQIQEASRSFLIFPFDVRCASLAAKLFKMGDAGRQKGTAEGRKCLRADSLIVATAKIHGATVLYSHDKRCRILAEKIGMTAKDLPSFAEKLFE